VVEQDGVLAVAMADGAGSARHAEIGAQCATDVVCELLVSAFDHLWGCRSGDLPHQLLAPLLVQLEQSAVAQSVHRRELASTLLFVAVKGRRYIAGNLGDGVVGCERTGQTAVLCYPQRGEYANETFFVTSTQAPQQLEVQLGTTDGMAAFCLMTDGAADILYDRRTQELAPAVQKTWAWLDTSPPAAVSQALETNLRQFCHPTTGDDCSLAIVRRVAMSPTTLRTRPAPYRRAFLGNGTAQGARNRLQVLEALSFHPTHPMSIAEVSKATGLSPQAVRRHAQALRWMLELDAEPLPGGLTPVGHPSPLSTSG
jgi:hypothetical protein